MFLWVARRSKKGTMPIENQLLYEQYSYFLSIIFVVIPIPLLNLGVSTTFFRIMTLNHKDLIYKTYQKQMIGKENVN